MRTSALILCLLSVFHIETARADANEVEYCSPFEVRNGEIYLLAPGFFREGPNPNSSQEIKNYKLIETNPRRYHFEFKKPSQEKRWIKCTYRKGTDKIERVIEVPHLLVSCDQVFKTGTTEVIESFRCKFRTISM